MRWQGENNEAESQEQKSCGEFTASQFVKIKGEFEATEELTDTHASKSAETTKGAGCFRRESKQHLNAVDCFQGDPLQEREIFDDNCGQQSCISS